ncbi:MAG: hypothetical protein ACYSSO_13340 [Planctomycetota bacterium]
MKKADIRGVQPFPKGRGLAAIGFQGGQIIVQAIIGPKKPLDPVKLIKRLLCLNAFEIMSIMTSDEPGLLVIFC